MDDSSTGPADDTRPDDAPRTVLPFDRPPVPPPVQAAARTTAQDDELLFLLGFVPPPSA